jgi:hypothetical protein
MKKGKNHNFAEVSSKISIAGKPFSTYNNLNSKGKDKKKKTESNF